MTAWARGEPPGGLTERELDVLQLVAQGLTNREIAQALDIAARTVEFHVSNVLEKSGVGSRWRRQCGPRSRDYPLIIVTFDPPDAKRIIGTLVGTTPH